MAHVTFADTAHEQPLPPDDAGADSSNWVFSFDDIVLSDTILGRGAFGEVRIARWRNIDVACKRLHSVDLSGEQDQQADEQDRATLQQEISMLSALRHPNLVLFLGICGDINGRNTAILTELLPCSLYDIIEVKKIPLDLPDVLEIALDVANGLAYLHRHDPPVIHRDISSKNILIRGSHAKIADLGQAKLFGHNTLSRQTGMPGAMAYAAPEVLTGKYSAKIDIFSFGILLSQMCSGEYPRIDRREDQIAKACTAQPLLERVMRNAVSYQPHERPFAHSICEILESIISNDRYYPNARRHAPEKEIGIIERSWIQEQIHTRAHDVEVELERTKSLLQAEEERWKAEAAKVDGIVNAKNDAEQNLQEALDVLARVKRQLEETQVDLSSKVNCNDDLRHQLQVIGTEMQRTNTKLQQQDTQIAQLLVEKSQAAETISKFSDDAQVNAQLLEASRRSEEGLTVQSEQLRLQLDMQLEYVRDLETRLEQALTRWRLDKDKLREEGARFAKVNSQCSAAIDKNERLQKTLDRYENRLQQYDDLPLPEEIQQRINDLQTDVDRSKNEALDLVAERDELQQERVELRGMVTDQLRTMEELQETLATRDAIIKDQQAELQKSQKTVMKVQREKKESDAAMEAITSSFDAMRATEQQLREELAEAKRELARERRMTEILRSQNPQLLLEAEALRPTATAAAAGTDGEVVAVIGGEMDGSEYSSSTQQQSAGAAGDDNNNTPAAVDGGSTSGIVDTNIEQHQETSFMALASVASLAREAPATEHPEDAISDAAVKHQVYWATEQAGTAGIISLMQQHVEDERFMWRGSRALREVVLQEADAKVLCYDSGMQEWFLSSLKSDKLLASSLAQGHAMRLVGALAFGNDWFRRKMGENGIMQCIIRVLETHQTEETTLLHTTTALTNLTHNSNENRSRFVELEGVDPLIAMMIRFKESAKLMRQACWAVLTLAAADDIAQLIASKGGDSAILNTMLINSADAGVQQFGCWALSNLALSSEDVARRIKKKGVIEVCRIALETHALDAEVVRQAQHTLGVFAPLPQKSGSTHHKNHEPQQQRPYSGDVRNVTQRNISAALATSSSSSDVGDARGGSSSSSSKTGGGASSNNNDGSNSSGANNRANSSNAKLFKNLRL